MTNNKGEERRQHLLAQLATQDGPLSASRLAKELGVSRQIIVGDVALLRASGQEITATARGYLLNAPKTPGIVSQIACLHTPEQTAEELQIMVASGAEVVDVLVEHPLYGELKGSLYIKTPQDIENFMAELAATDSVLLSSLTGGVHLHTVITPTVDEVNALKAALRQAHILYEG